MGTSDVGSDEAELVHENGCLSRLEDRLELLMIQLEMIEIEGNGI